MRPGVPAGWTAPHGTRQRRLSQMEQFNRRQHYKEHTEERAAGQLVVLTWRAKTITFLSPPL